MKDITCDGFYDTNTNTYDVNTSSIVSHLIRECGKLVEDYNSDLLIDLNTILGYIKSPTGDDTNRTFWIGLRESGVDGEEFIRCRCCSDYYYRGLYKVLVDKKEGRCWVTLSKSSAYDFRKEHNIFK